MKTIRNALTGLALLAVVATAPATAQEIEEIIVTAAKREQSLQDVSIAVAAVSGAELEANLIHSMEDLQFLIPNIVFGNDFNFAKTFIRGLGYSASFHGIDPAVAMHVDGAVIGRASGQFTSLFDLERVEVLRGPQSTLYGRNNTGGTVNLITAKPADHNEGYLRLTVGGDDLNVIGEGAVSVPFSDTVRSRISFRIQDREGYGLNESTGQDIDDAQQTAVRAQLQFLPSENVEFRFIGEWYEEDDSAYLQLFLAPSFTEEITGQPVPPNFESLGTVAPAGLATIPRNIRSHPDWSPINYKETWYLTGLLDWGLNDSVTLRSITNYRELETILGHDFTMSDFPHAPLPYLPGQTSAVHDLEVRQEQWSQEFQLLYDTDRFHAIFGLYYLDEHIRGDNKIGDDPFNTPDLINRVMLDGDMNIEASAVFANLTFDLSDQWSIRVAGRYSSEDRDLLNEFRAAPPFSDTNLTAPPTKDPPLDFIANDWSDFSPELGVDFKPSDNILAYFTYSEGFRSGTSVIGNNFPTWVEPEEIENYEIGLKSNLADNTVQLNLAAFSYELINGQFNRTIPIPAPPFFLSTLENAASQEGQGLEIDMLWQATDELRIRASGTFLDAEYTSLDAVNPIDPLVPYSPDPTVIPTQNLAGFEPRNSPDFQGNLNIAYDQPLGGGAILTWSGNVSYKGSQFYNEFNDPRLGADSYSILDGYIRYTSGEGNWSVSAWIKNATDELVVAGAFPISTSRTISGRYLPPRRYGITAEFGFD